MQIEKLPVDRLIPYARNSRTHDDAQVAQIAASIREFGFTNPILIDEKDSIIAGHGRVMAARKLGMVEVPCIRLAHLTDAQKRAYVIADNKLALNAGWDDEMLKLELADLKAENFDLSLTGFSVEEIAELTIEEPENPDADAEPQTDKADELREKWGVESGQIWQLGEHRIICGNSTNGSDIDRLMAGEIATMTFTDPPWNVAIGKDSNPRHRQRSGLENDDLSPEDFKNFLGSFAEHMIRVCDGDVYVVLGASEWPTLDSCLRGVGYHWSASVIWVKDIFVLGRSKYHRRYEPLWYGWHKSHKSSFGERRDLDDVWEIARPRKSEEHPTMKPVELPQRAIENSSSPGQIVYEPFSGGGSTLLACERTGRKCRAIDISPAYVAVAIQRWHDATGKDPRKL